MVAKQTQDEFIKKSKNIFKNKLDYSLVNYTNSRDKVTIICKLHGPFIIAPKDHISYKRGCGICKGICYNTDTFIAAAKKIHKSRFIYDKVVFKNIKESVIITCKMHGDFLQKPDKHINARQGCPKCKKSSKKNLEYVIKMGSVIHNGKYDYSLSNFTRMSDPILIICPRHGEFKQTPANHINHKQNCPACMVGTSKKEKEWLDYIGLPDNSKYRSVILRLNLRKFIVDGFDSDTNTVYEFYGDYWHGNPNIYKSNDINEGNKLTFGELYRKTLEREAFLKKNNYKIISIWEQEFDKIIKLPKPLTS